MKGKLRIIIGAAAAILAAVSVFVLFANGIGSEGGMASMRGNTFQIMFGTGMAGTNAIPLLILAFSFECACIGLALFAGFMPGVIGKGLFGVSTALLVTAGILFLNTRTFYLNANYVSPTGYGLGNIGPGPICSAIFAFVSAIVCAYGVVRKEN